MSNLIDRQAAIDAIEHRLAEPAYLHTGEDWYVGMNSAESELNGLPSAQPEIIRCNDCKHWTQTTGNMRGFGLGDCDYINAKLVNCNGFCYWAERREE